MQRNLNHSQKNTTNLAQNLQRKLLTLVVFTAILLVVVQIVILSRVGTSGKELSDTRSEISHLQIENELKSAQIRDLQTNSQILVSAYNELGMQPQALNLLENPAKLDSNLAIASN